MSRDYKAIAEAHAKGFAQMGYYLKANQSNVRNQGVQSATLMRHMMDTVASYSADEFIKEIEGYMESHPDGILKRSTQNDKQFILNWQAIHPSNKQSANNVADFISYMNTNCHHAKFFEELTVSALRENSAIHTVHSALPHYDRQVAIDEYCISQNRPPITQKRDNYEELKATEQDLLGGIQQLMSNTYEADGGNPKHRINAMKWVKRITELNEFIQYGKDPLGNYTHPHSTVHNMDSWRKALSSEHGRFRSSQFSINVTNLTDEEYLVKNPNGKLENNLFGWELIDFSANQENKICLPRATDASVQQALNPANENDLKHAKIKLHDVDNESRANLTASNISAVSIYNQSKGIAPVKMMYACGLLEMVAKNYAERDCDRKGTIDPAQAPAIISKAKIQLAEHEQSIQAEPSVERRAYLEQEMGHIDKVNTIPYKLDQSNHPNATVNLNLFNVKIVTDNTGRQQFVPDLPSKRHASMPDRPAFIFTEAGGDKMPLVNPERNDKILRIQGVRASVEQDPQTQVRSLGSNMTPVEILTTTSGKMNKSRSDNTAVIYGYGNGVALANQNYVATAQMDKLFKGMTLVGHQQTHDTASQDIAVALNLGMQALTQLGGKADDKMKYFAVSDDKLNEKVKEIYLNQVQEHAKASGQTLDDAQVYKQLEKLNGLFNDPVFAFNTKAYLTFGFDLDPKLGISPKNDFKGLAQEFQDSLFLTKSVQDNVKKQEMMDALQQVAKGRLYLNMSAEERVVNHGEICQYALNPNADEGELYTNISLFEQSDDYKEIQRERGTIGYDNENMNLMSPDIKHALSADESLKELKTRKFTRSWVYDTESQGEGGYKHGNLKIIGHHTTHRVTADRAENDPFTSIMNQTGNNYVKKKFLNHNEHQLWVGAGDEQTLETVKLPNSRRVYANLFEGLQRKGLATGFDANTLGDYEEKARYGNMTITHTEGVSPSAGVYVLTGKKVDTHNNFSPEKYRTRLNVVNSDEQITKQARQMGKTAISVFRVEFSPTGDHTVENFDDVGKIKSAQNYINDGNGVQKLTAQHTEPMGTITPLVENLNPLATADKPNVLYIGEGLETMHAVGSILGLNDNTQNTALYACHDVNNLKKVCELLANAQHAEDNIPEEQRSGFFAYDKKNTQIRIMGDNDYVWRGKDMIDDMRVYADIFKANKILPQNPAEFEALYKTASIHTQLGKTFKMGDVEIPPLKNPETGKIIKNAGMTGALHAKALLAEAGYDVQVVLPNPFALESLRKYNMTTGELAERDRKNRADYTDFSDLWKAGERYVYGNILNAFGENGHEVAKRLSEHGSFYEGEFDERLGFVNGADQTALFVFRETQRTLTDKGFYHSKPIYEGLDANGNAIINMGWQTEEIASRMGLDKELIDTNVRKFQEDMLIGKETLWNSEYENKEMFDDEVGIVPDDLLEQLDTKSSDPMVQKLCGYMNTQVVATAYPTRQTVEKALLNNGRFDPNLEAKTFHNIVAVSNLSTQTRTHNEGTVSEESRPTYPEIAKMNGKIAKTLAFGSVIEEQKLDEEQKLMKGLMEEHEKGRTIMAVVSDSLHEFSRLEHLKESLPSQEKSALNKVVTEETDRTMTRLVATKSAERTKIRNQKKQYADESRKVKEVNVAHILDDEIDKKLDEYLTLAYGANNERLMGGQALLLSYLPEHYVQDYQSNYEQLPPQEKDKTKDNLYAIQKELNQRSREMGYPNMNVFVKDKIVTLLAFDYMASKDIALGSKKDAVMQSGDTVKPWHPEVDKTWFADLRKNNQLLVATQNTIAQLANEGTLPKRAQVVEQDGQRMFVRDSNQEQVAQNDQNQEKSRLQQEEARKVQGSKPNLS